MAFRKEQYSPVNGEKKKAGIPTFMLCPLCKDILDKAVITPCCGESFCDQCKSTMIYI